MAVQVVRWGARENFARGDLREPLKDFKGYLCRSDKLWLIRLHLYHPAAAVGFDTVLDRPWLEACGFPVDAKAVHKHYAILRDALKKEGSASPHIAFSIERAFVRLRGETAGISSEEIEQLRLRRGIESADGLRLKISRTKSPAGVHYAPKKKKRHKAPKPKMAAAMAAVSIAADTFWLLLTKSRDCMITGGSIGADGFGAKVRDTDTESELLKLIDEQRIVRVQNEELHEAVIEKDAENRRLSTELAEVKSVMEQSAAVEDNRESEVEAQKLVIQDLEERNKRLRTLAGLSVAEEIPEPKKKTKKKKAKGKGKGKWKPKGSGKKGKQKKKQKHVLRKGSVGSSSQESDHFGDYEQSQQFQSEEDAIAAAIAASKCSFEAECFVYDEIKSVAASGGDQMLLEAEGVGEAEPIHGGEDDTEKREDDTEKREDDTAENRHGDNDSEENAMKIAESGADDIEVVALLCDAIYAVSERVPAKEHTGLGLTEHIVEDLEMKFANSECSDMEIDGVEEEEDEESEQKCDDVFEEFHDADAADDCVDSEAEMWCDMLLTAVTDNVNNATPLMLELDSFHTGTGAVPTVGQLIGFIPAKALKEKRMKYILHLATDPKESALSIAVRRDLRSDWKAPHFVNALKGAIDDSFLWSQLSVCGARAPIYEAFDSENRPSLELLEAVLPNPSVQQNYDFWRGLSFQMSGLHILKVCAQHDEVTGGCMRCDLLQVFVGSSVFQSFLKDAKEWKHGFAALAKY